ncbi:MAG TPA: POTRA domain-containing protein, partial [Pseudomonadales bacterium]
MKQFLAVLILVFTLISTPAFSQSFYVSDIRVEGLQRVSAHALFSEFPINVGDEVNSAILRRATSLLFRTGNFDDIELLRDGDVLIIKVVERPSISSIKIAGNETLPTEVLMNALKQSGLSEGEIFKRATLDRIHLELERQYTGQGRYGAKIVAEVKEESRNRVALSINITEGDVASILHI